MEVGGGEVRESEVVSLDAGLVQLDVRGAVDETRGVGRSRPVVDADVVACGEVLPKTMVLMMRGVDALNRMPAQPVMRLPAMTQLTTFAAPPTAMAPPLSALLEPPPRTSVTIEFASVPPPMQIATPWWLPSSPEDEPTMLDTTVCVTRPAAM